MEHWKIWLVVTDGLNEGDTIPVHSDEFLIGRRDGCHLRPEVEGVADLHCAVLTRNGRFFVRNYCHPEGTSVGCRQVLGGIELHNGDSIQVGERRLQVRIMRRACSVVAPVPSEAYPAAVGEVTWSASCPGWPSAFFVTCSTVLPPIEELPAPDPAEPLSAPEMFEEEATSGETPSLLPAALGLEPPTDGNSEENGDPAEMIEVVELPGLPSAEESAPETVAEVMTPEETAYVPFAELEGKLSIAVPEIQPAAPCPVQTPSPKPRRPSSPSPVETDRPRKADSSAHPLPARPFYLVGRLDRAMTTLRQQAWDAATKPNVPASTAPPPKTWKRWLPALGGVFVGMALVGVFYLAALRAGPPTPLSPPPRGHLRPGRVVVHYSPPLTPAKSEPHPHLRSEPAPPSTAPRTLPRRRRGTASSPNP